MANNLGGGIQDRYHEGYSQELLHVFQQKKSRLRNFVTTVSGEGNVQYFDKKGPSQTQEVTQRRQLREIQDASYERRLISTHTIATNEAFDDILDVDAQINTPRPHIMDSMYMAMEREVDRHIIAGMVGDQAVQTNGSITSVPFDSANMQVAVNFNTGTEVVGNSSLHEAKINEALLKLGTSEAFDDGYEVFVVGHLRQLNMLKSRVMGQRGAGWFQGAPDANNADFGSALMNFQGVTRYITCNNIPDVGGHDAVYVFVRKAIRLWMLREPKIRIYNDDRYVDSPPALEGTMKIGVARVYEDGIARILCHKTAGFPTA